MSLGIPIVTVTVKLARDPSLFQRDHNRFSRQANVKVAEFHKEHHIPRHFESFAGAKYGYWKRKPKYLKRKKRLVGEKPDNVFSGKSKRQIISSHGTIRATPKGSRLILKLPIDGGTGRVLNEAAAARLFAAGKRKNLGFTKQQKQSQIQILHRVAELEAVSGDEVRTLARVRLEEYTRLANEPGTKKRIRIRTK